MLCLKITSLVTCERGRGHERIAVKHEKINIYTSLTVFRGMVLN